MKQLFSFLAAAALTVSCATSPATVTKSGIDPKAFEGQYNGKATALYTLTNESGMEVCITNFGGRIVSIMVPDKDGMMRDVVLGFDNIQDYIDIPSDFGAAIGRYANRIANATFTLDGVEYQLTKNNGQNILHGGSNGFDHTIWDVVKVTKNSVVFSCTLADGLDGFPGNFTTTLTFSVTKDNGVSISYKAKTDKATVCNMSHHAYFNLEGMDAENTLDHVLMINADYITESDRSLIPTGNLLPVDGTVYDFRQPVRIGDRQFASPAGFGRPVPGAPMPEIPEGMVRSYDQNFCLNHSSSDKVELVASLYSPKTGRLMEVLNNHPGMQLFTGNRKAVAMESQMFPDSPNHPEFPNTVLRPGETYHHNVVYRFSVK